MTPEVVYNQIQQSFPELGLIQIVNEMDSQERRFARESGVLKKVGSLQTLTSKAYWAVPSDFDSLYEVELYDSVYAPLNKTDEDLDWYIDSGGTGGFPSPGTGTPSTTTANQLRFFSTNGTEISTIPTSITYILVRYSYLPASILTEVTASLKAFPSTFSVPDQFSEAILAATLSAFYGRIRTPMQIDKDGNVVKMIDRNSRDYWEAKYKRLEIEAKRWMNNLDSTPREVQNYQHAGMYSLPKEHTDATLVAAATSWT